MTSQTIEAQFKHGMKLYNQKNYKEAAKCLAKPAAQGDLNSQCVLSCMRYLGEGIDQDKQTAIDNLLILADQGHKHSIEILKGLLRNDS